MRSRLYQTTSSVGDDTGECRHGTCRILYALSEGLLQDVFGMSLLSEDRVTQIVLHSKRSGELAHAG